LKKKSFFKARKIGIKTLSKFGLHDKILEPPTVESNIPIVYHALNEDIKFINATSSDSGLQLPDKLIISKGVYNFFKKDYTLKEEGLYRFIYPGHINQQRIVYENDLNSLLSAICWVSSHGNSDDKKNFLEIYNKALSSKVFLTCGPIIEWIIEILKNYSIKCRIVSSLTLEEWNSYDNGHVMIEIYNDDMKKWVVYDLDNNCFFESNKKPLSFIEFFYCVKNKNYKINYLSPQSNMAISKFVDDNTNFDYNFILETKLSTEKLRRIWYKRIIQVPLITDGNFNYFFDLKNKNKIESYSSYYKFLTQENFMHRFYV